MRIKYENVRTYMKTNIQTVPEKGKLAKSLRATPHPLLHSMQGKPEAYMVCGHGKNIPHTHTYVHISPNDYAECVYAVSNGIRGGSTTHIQLMLITVNQRNPPSPSSTSNNQPISKLTFSTYICVSSCDITPNKSVICAG